MSPLAHPNLPQDFPSLSRLPLPHKWTAFPRDPCQSVAGQSIRVEAAGSGASSKPNRDGIDSTTDDEKDGGEHRSSNGGNESRGEEVQGKNSEDKVQEEKAGKKKGRDKGKAGGGVGYGSYGGFEGDYSGGGYDSYKKKD